MIDGGLSVDGGIGTGGTGTTVGIGIVISDGAGACIDVSGVELVGACDDASPCDCSTTWAWVEC